MNNKKAKLLRKTAAQATIGLPNVAYNGYSQPYYSVNSSNVAEKFVNGTQREMSECTRKLYKKYKRGYYEN